MRGGDCEERVRGGEGTVRGGDCEERDEGRGL